MPSKKNDLVILNPLVQHTEVSKRDTPLDYYVIGIENLNIESKTGDKTHSILHFSNDSSSIKDCFTNILNEMQKKDQNYEDIYQNYLAIILLKIKRKATVRVIIDEPDKGSRECQLIKNYIDSNYSDYITFDILAAKYNLSKFYLCH